MPQPRMHQTREHNLLGQAEMCSQSDAFTSLSKNTENPRSNKNSLPQLPNVNITIAVRTPFLGSYISSELQCLEKQIVLPQSWRTFKP